MRTCGNLELVDKISPNVASINKVLTEDFLSYSSMRALECFIEEHIEQDSKPGVIFPILTSGTWKKPGKSLGSGTYGSVNLLTIFERSLIVMKDFTDLNSIEQAQNEYLIGKRLNELRYYCPNFCYTIGAFSELSPSREEIPFICYEYSGSTTLSSYVYEKTTTPKDIFCILIQVFVALQIAQDKCNFMHADLSNANILIRDRRTTYKVVVNNSEYEFNDVQCPVIIDFGFSGIDTEKGRLSTLSAIGFDEGDYGKFSFLVQGYDVFFILADLAVYSGGKNKKFILDLIKSIYGNKNPYDFSRIANRPSDQWSKIFTHKHGGTFTPLEVVEKMLKIYPGFNKSIRVSTRREFEVNSLSTIITQFYHIANAKIERDLKRCFSKVDSNLMTLYYSKGTDSPKHKSLKADKEIIDTFYSAAVVDITRECNDILNMPFKRGYSRSYFKDFFKLLEIVDAIEVYFIFYYMILELKPDESLYRNFAIAFRDSKVYKYYEKNIQTITAARKWANTLIELNNIRKR